MKFYKFTLINNIITAAEEISHTEINDTLVISRDNADKRYFYVVANSAVAQHQAKLFQYGQQQYNDYLKRPYPVAVLEKHQRSSN